jgi:hypothetical protein
VDYYEIARYECELVCLYVCFSFFKLFRRKGQSSPDLIAHVISNYYDYHHLIATTTTSANLS